VGKVFEGIDGHLEYQREQNAYSIDGLPALDRL
jgi:hypothetical protein